MAVLPPVPFDAFSALGRVKVVERASLAEGFRLHWVILTSSCVMQIKSKEQRERERESKKEGNWEQKMAQVMRYIR